MLRKALAALFGLALLSAHPAASAPLVSDEFELAQILPNPPGPNVVVPKKDALWPGCITDAVTGVVSCPGGQIALNISGIIVGNGANPLTPYAGTACSAGEFIDSLSSFGVASCGVPFSGLADGLVKVTAGVPGTYAGQACGAGQVVSAINNNGTITCVGSGGGGSTPGGPDWAIQYNLAGLFGGVAMDGLVLASSGGAPIVYPGTFAPAHQFLTALDSGGSGASARPACADLSDAGAGCTGAAAAAAANPTATVGAAAVNGAASTYMRSDAAPALSTTAVTPGSYTLSGVTVDANGRLTAASSYAGATCTNQFVRALSASGAATCATVSPSDVSLANLSATDSTLTFSGTYNGSTARTVGLNLGNSNSWTAGQAVTPVALSISGGAVAVDASLSNDYTLTAGSNFTLSNPTNLKAGQTINIWVTQDGTGSRVITWGSQYQAAGGTSSLVLSTAAAAKDIIACVSDTSSSLTCALLKAIAH